MLYENGNLVNNLHLKGKLLQVFNFVIVFNKIKSIRFDIFSHNNIPFSKYHCRYYYKACSQI